MFVKCRRAIVDRSFFYRHGGEVSPPRTSPLAKPAENNSARDFAAIVFFRLQCAEVLSHHDIFKVMASWRRCFKRSDRCAQFCSAGVSPAFCAAWGSKELPARRRRYISNFKRAGAPCQKPQAVGESWRACTAAWWTAKSVPAIPESREGPRRRPASAWRMRAARNADASPN
jgi:hypothetical protein